jgi:ankyrin repeat protein
MQYNCFLQINESGPVNQIPLLVAAASGCCEIVQLLLEKGANVNAEVLRVLKPLVNV